MCHKKCELLYSINCLKDLLKLFFMFFFFLFSCLFFRKYFEVDVRWSHCGSQSKCHFSFHLKSSPQKLKINPSPPDGKLKNEQLKAGSSPCSGWRQADTCHVICKLPQLPPSCVYAIIKTLVDVRRQMISVFVLVLMLLSCKLWYEAVWSVLLGSHLILGVIIN